MALLLGGASALTGGITGLVAGTAWAVAGLDPLGADAVAALIAVAVAGDLAALRWPAARPVDLGRQVPQAWGRLFGARLVAALYGARLGVGPLTILTTWTWWAAFVIGASLGPWASTGVGIAFALARTLTTLAVGRGVRDGVVMRARVQALARTEPVVVAGSAGLLGVAALGLALQ